MKHDVDQAIHGFQSTEDPRTGAREATASLRFPKELPVFAGHFPGMPILPGIYLIEAARILSERCLDRRLRIAEVVDARFLGEVQPDSVLRGELALIQQDEHWRVDASFFLNRTSVCRVRVRLRLVCDPA